MLARKGTGLAYREPIWQLYFNFVGVLGCDLIIHAEVYLEIGVLCRPWFRREY